MGGATYKQLMDKDTEEDEDFEETEPASSSAAGPQTLKQSNERLLKQKMHKSFRNTVRNTVHMSLFFLGSRVNRVMASVMGFVARPLYVEHGEKCASSRSIPKLLQRTWGRRV